MIEEMEIVIGADFWPEPPGEAPQARREAVPHLCRRCLGTIERHAGDGVGETFWCSGCGSAGRELAEVCFCGVSRAGARLICTRLAGEAGGPGDLVVVEADDDPKVGQAATGAMGAATA